MEYQTSYIHYQISKLQKMGTWNVYNKVVAMVKT